MLLLEEEFEPDGPGALGDHQASRRDLQSCGAAVLQLSQARFDNRGEEVELVQMAAPEQVTDLLQGVGHRCRRMVRVP